MQIFKKTGQPAVSYVAAAVIAISGFLASTEFFKTTDVESFVVGAFLGLSSILISMHYTLIVEKEKISNLLQEYDIIAKSYVFANEYGDLTYRNKLEELIHQLNNLSIGKYSLHSLEDVYDDNISSFNESSRGEELFSVCPMASDPAAAVEQVGKPSFKKSMNSHAAAAERGVDVTRVYRFNNREILEIPEIKSHISEMVGRKVRVGYIFESDNRFNSRFQMDFILFGKSKVSVGRLGNKFVVGSDVSYLTDDIREYERQKIAILNIMEIANID